MSGALDGLVHRIRPAVSTPEGALVLFHGRGADELDLVPLLDAIDPESRLIGLTPRGPLSLPPGGAHWYRVERIGYPDRATFADGFARAAAWLDAIPAATGVPIEHTVIGGFSQGAVMAHALGLGSGRPRPAGIVALSGFIPTVDGFQLDLDARVGLPVAIGHGSADPVIGVEFGREARDRLEAAGMKVAYRESPMAHSIDPSFITELQAWTRAALDSAPT